MLAGDDEELRANPAHAVINTVLARLEELWMEPITRPLSPAEAKSTIEALRSYREQFEKLRVGNLDYSAQVSRMLQARDDSPPAALETSLEKMLEVVCVGMRDQAVQMMRVVLEEVLLSQRRAASASGDSHG